MRRKRGQLVPNEVDLLVVAAELAEQGVTEFHGFEIAKRMGERPTRHPLLTNGGVYRALIRLETGGWLASRWEDPDVAIRESRPRRRLYRVARRALGDRP